MIIKCLWYNLGVTSHGYSCEVCKYKVHKRCLDKAISNCKWTTLASVGKDIVEDKQGVMITNNAKLHFFIHIFVVFYILPAMIMYKKTQFKI